ncbi:MAG: MerR family transcriptional regulator, partial [Verrucomicrobiota bacterium]
KKPPGHPPMPIANTMSEPLSQEQFQISAVSRLTGLPIHSIRAWERRYQVVDPERTETDRRLYSRRDIQKLTLLKTLVDQGEPISSVAPLSVEELEQRILFHGHAQQKSLPAPSPPPKKCRLIICGDSLLSLIGDGSALGEASVVATSTTLDRALVLPDLPHADLILGQTPTLFDDTVSSARRLLERTSARRIILLYEFAQTKVLKDLEKTTGVTAVRSPLGIAELQLICQADVGIARRAYTADKSLPNSVPPPRFTRTQLAYLRQISTSIDCECPQHLADLLNSLTAFEDYSRQCQNVSAEDAAVHTALYHSTGQARFIIEKALTSLLEYEKIDFPENLRSV